MHRVSQHVPRNTLRCILNSNAGIRPTEISLASNGPRTFPNRLSAAGENMCPRCARLHKRFAIPVSVMVPVGASPAWTWHSSVSRGPALLSLGLVLPGRSSNFATGIVFGRRPSKHVGYVVSEAKNDKQLSTTGEAGPQSHSLALKTADPLTAIGLVHRSLVTEAQNARRVSSSPLWPCRISSRIEVTTLLSHPTWTIP